MTNWTRRNFIKTTGVAGGTLAAIPSLSLNSCKPKSMKQITIEATNSNFEREPLIRPFGFKGGYMSEIWQTAAWMKSTSEIEKVGLCTQNVLWSDAKVFASFSESGGNSMMYGMTEYALKILESKTFSSPVALLDEILDEVYAYGQKITDNVDLRKTFALNALVGVDNAAWMLFAAENGITSFDEMIPEEYRPALSHHHETVASIPLMAYSIPVSEIKQAADDGYFFMKIKIGQPGTQEEMLEKDKTRLSEIHKAIGHYTTEHSKDGKL
ncbi:MAG: twin-arginine translocation signal domain-containing protein, partial [Draconibacterium sp.]|nr:twin-arginine translocation signal domain-containing protein [Draconibacterium sp.]